MIEAQIYQKRMIELIRRKNILYGMLEILVVEIANTAKLANIEKTIKGQ